MDDTIALHNRLMEEGYIEAAASKINQKLDELRESGNERLCRRWVWELIQNANDCADPDLEINIMREEKKLTFSHNGKPFDYQSLMNLITQISKKESSNENDNNTGKFGTGFITTHLLADQVELKGIFVDENKRRVELDFLLDRSGEDIFEVKEQVIKSLEELKKLNQRQEIEQSTYEYNTNFIYDIFNANNKALGEGEEDLDKTIFFVLAFVKTINKLQYNDTTYWCSEDDEQLILDGLKIVKVHKVTKGNTITKQILVGYDDIVELAVVIKNENGLNCIEEFHENMPKLFCNFPLIGTEKFAFPIVVNCSEFKVEERRDGIFESSDHNKKILSKAINVYEMMMDYIVKNNFHDAYNMCLMKKDSTSPLQNEVYKDIKKIIEHAKAIYTNKEEFDALTSEENKTNVMIPNCNNKETGELFYDLMNSMKINQSLPKKGHHKKWGKAIGTNFDFEDLCKWIDKKSSFDDLRSYFESEEGMFKWFQHFYQIAFQLEKGKYAKKHFIFVNQNRKLDTKFQDLYIDNDIDKLLLDILADLGSDIRCDLFLNEIDLSTFVEEHDIKSRDNKYIANRICDKIRKIWIEEAKSNDVREKEVQEIFDKLTVWFYKNPKIVKRLFADIYEQKLKLCTNEELVEKIEFANRTKQTLEKYDIDSVDKLNEWLEHHTNSEGYFSQYKIDDLLLGLAIDNIEELESNNNIESVKYVLKHNPKPSYETMQVIQEKIVRSKRNVINYLNSLKGIYDVSNKRELARTVYGDIKKNGQPIKIVVRPSDGEMIILFYQSELDVLDDNNYELWIDNGQDVPRQLTFGDILMTTGIRVIPLRNLYENEY